MNKNIIITGTNGYVGSHLAESLERNGNTIQRLSVRNSLWKNLSFSSVDTIIHTAALVHNNDPSAKLEDYFKVNTHLPIELAKKAKEDGVHQFIFMSTMAVYGKDGEMEYIDEIKNPSDIHPITNYGISKAKAEEKLLKMNDEDFKIVIVRPPMIYGENSPGNFSRLKNVAKILPVIPKINNKRSALYIKHLESYIKQLIDRDYQGIYHPKDSFNFDTTEVITEIRNSLKKKTILFPIPKFIYPYLSKVKIISKLYGNLIYGNDLYLYETKLETEQQDFKTIINDIMNDR
ncbi:NAD-dependent epimerase/dehydratase family protein [Staphylococcus haemolyticus]|uniref:NAD-dependent epimerase/dehydratase family protein n=1 Tax=Staphylococcus sp. GDX8P54P TaxID=2804099 RepID=UPI00188061C8|nr:NAD-dependent epimerase/dehydratase family protein [Staphylococcus sp. GDX8P54P]MBF2758606.1 NAD-dependent epimerase/dehydratase family protein [Staphylococcus haemolyticus]MBF2774900.1 NAD-dependent epimerase/dehydratase family protein [Staphylococcus haemolyticus]MBF2777473.1 NAD-dependent epimerase/dehydratase family protein [Staphylococcus haemolyticus]MBF2816198.1 NAD-dependent epimerase/dehydratase family protein [Staphylococcus haemolyticus]MBF9721755.1 NAD-dependent epimerase/dehydr